MKAVVQVNEDGAETWVVAVNVCEENSLFINQDLLRD